jgi:hypothetical protein
MKIAQLNFKVPEADWESTHASLREMCTRVATSSYFGLEEDDFEVFCNPTKHHIALKIKCQGDLALLTAGAISGSIMTLDTARSGKWKAWLSLIDDEGWNQINAADASLQRSILDGP